MAEDYHIVEAERPHSASVATSETPVAPGVMARFADFARGLGRFYFGSVGDALKKSWFVLGSASTALGVATFFYRTRTSATPNEGVMNALGWQVPAISFTCFLVLTVVFNAYRKYRRLQEGAVAQERAWEQKLDRLVKEQKPCVWYWPHMIANSHASAIDQYVGADDSGFQLHELLRADPYVEFNLYTYNNSIFNVAFDDPCGSIFFADRLLSEPMRWTEEPEEVLQSFRGVLTIQQSLSTEDAKYILETSGEKARFDFGRLKIMVKGSDGFENIEPKRLPINTWLSNEHLLQAYGVISPQPSLGALTATVAELEAALLKDKAALTMERLRGHILQALSILYGKGTGLVNHLFYGTISPDEARYLIETWKDRLDTAIGDWLGASPLNKFRDGLLPLPESLEDQREWIKHTNGKLDKMIQGILNGESIDMKRIKVRSTSKLEPDGGYRVALSEQHRAHPEGQLFLAEPKVVEVAETVKVAEAIQGGRLTVVD